MGCLVELGKTQFLENGINPEITGHVKMCERICLLKVATIFYCRWLNFMISHEAHAIQP